MNWSRYPILSNRNGVGPSPVSLYRSHDPGGFQVAPYYARSRNGRRRLRGVVWHLHLDGRQLGRPFDTAWLAKAFAEAYSALDSNRARREFVANGGEWCYQKSLDRRRR